MIIAINTKIIGENETEESGNFMYEVFTRIIKDQPQYNFIIISEKNPEHYKNLSNVTSVVISPQARHPLQWFMWYNIKITSVLKKYKADIFISYGVGSASAKTPQCIIIPHLNFIHHPETFKRSELFFLKKYTAKCLKKAKLIITVSAFCKAEIEKYFKAGDKKIDVVYKGTDEIVSPTFIESAESIKSKYTDGNEFFLYKGEIGLQKNLMNLLRAFSAFKKRQKSSMQLIIVGKPGFKYEKVLESIRLFKFKNEVKIITEINNQELKKIIAAAYAFIYPSAYESFPSEAIEAMKSGVPVIISPTSSMPEICADAALYADPENFKAIAVQMMLLFKNETTRNELIEKGKQQAEKYNWDTTAELTWKAMKEEFEF